MNELLVTVAQRLDQIAHDVPGRYGEG